MVQRDVGQEDIATALKALGSDRRFIDRQDYVTYLKRLGDGHKHVDDQDISEFLITAQGGFGGNVPLPTKFLSLTRSDTALQLTTVRTGNAWAENLEDVYSLFPASIPRITNKGLLVEEARTNSVANNSMTGAVVGTPGTLPTGWGSPTPAANGVTHQVVGKGTEKGVDYIDIRFSGTPIGLEADWWAEIDLTGLIPATPGQFWALSAFLAITGGNLNNLIAPELNTAAMNGSTFVASPCAIPLTSIPGSLTRITTPGTMPASTTHWILNLFFYFDGPVNFTIRIGWPQVELGAFATSPIRTTSAAVTRAADMVSFANPALVNAPAFSMFWDFTPICDASQRSVTAVLGGWADALTFTNTAYASLSSGGLLSPNVVTAGAGVFSGSFSGLTGKTPTRFAYGAKLNDGRAAMNGTLGAADAAIPVSAGPATQLRIGGSPWVGTASAVLNAWIRSFALWSERLTDAHLRQITGE